jgi:dTDP-4-amino-4,6-dideoxygalactose transaminase
MTDPIFLSPPHLSGDELKILEDTLESNWIAPKGPQLDAWENELGTYAEVAHTLLLNSGTAAIHLALHVLEVGEGDDVLIQSNTHIGSVSPIKYLKANPIFVDSEPDTWNMDPVVLEEAIKQRMFKGQKPKAIILVHLYGMPAKMDLLLAVADKYNIPVVEDAAEALGSSYKEKKCGSLGALGIYSFNGNKIITTGGGGALLSHKDHFNKQARLLATQARDNAIHYEHSMIGFNYRMSNVLAGLGRAQMGVLDQHIHQRRSNYQRYQDYFNSWNQKGFRIRFQQEPDGHFSNRWLTCIVVDPDQNYGLSSEILRLGMLDDNIESRPLWKPMHLQPIFAGCIFFGTNVSGRLFETGLCLPSGSSLSNEDFDRIFSILDKVIAPYSRKID